MRLILNFLLEIAYRNEADLGNIRTTFSRSTIGQWILLQPGRIFRTYLKS